MEKCIIFILGLQLVVSTIALEFDRFADVEDITDGNCGINVDKFNLHKEDANWKDVKAKATMTLLHCDIQNYGPGAICFLGMSNKAMQSVREKMQIANKNIGMMWMDGQCESTTDGQTDSPLKFDFYNCKKQADMEPLDVAKTVGRHIKTAMQNDQDRKCDVLKEQKMKFKSILRCMPRMLQQELFGANAECKNDTAAEILSSAEILDEQTIKELIRAKREAEQNGQLDEDSIKEFASNPSTLKTLTQEERETLRSLSKEEREPIVKENLAKKKEEKLKENAMEDMSKSKAELQRKRKTKVKSKAEVKEALAMKHVIGTDVQGLSADVQMAMLEDDTLMQTMSPNQRAQFSTDVVCSTDPTSDLLADSTPQVGKCMAETCKDTAAATQKESLVKHRKSTDLDADLQDSDDGQKEETIGKICKNPTELSPMQRKVLKNHTEPLVLTSQSLDITQIENLACALIEMSPEMVTEKLTTPETKLKFCSKMKDVNIENATKIDEWKEFCLTVSDVSLSDLGEALQGITADEVNSREDKEIYDNVKNLCRYMCKAESKMAVFEKMKSQIGSLETFNADDLVNLAPCIPEATDEDQRMVREHAELGDAYSEMSEALEDAQLYSQQRNCSTEVQIRLTEAVNSGGLLSDAMAAHIASADQTTTRRKKRALSDMDTFNVTCDNIDGLKITLLTDNQLQGLADAIYSDCPESLGQTDGFTASQLSILAESLIKVYSDPIANWEAAMLLDFGVLLLGLDESQINMLQLTDDVVAAIGARETMLQDNTKYEQIFTRWAVIPDPTVTAADLTPEQLERLQNVVCGIPAEDMRDIMVDSYESASTIIGEVMCLTAEQGMALAAKATDAYGNTAANFTSAITASIGVVAGFLPAEVLTAMDESAISSLSDMAISIIPANVLMMFSVDQFNAMSREQANAIKQESYSQVGDSVRQHIDSRRQGLEAAGDTEQGINLYRDNTGDDNNEDTTDMGDKPGGENDGPSGDGENDDDKEPDDSIRDPIRESDERPSIPLSQICAASDLDDETLKSLENVKGIDDEDWHVALLCKQLFQDAEALKRLSQVKGTSKNIIAMVINRQFMNMPDQGNCLLEAAACWAFDERYIMALEADTVQCIATNMNCCKNQEGGCEMISEKAWMKKIFDTQLKESQDIGTKLDEYCCWLDELGTKEVQEITADYGPHDTDFDDAITCAVDCSQKLLMSKVTETRWREVNLGEESATEEQRTAIINNLTPEDAKLVTLEDAKDVTVDQAKILLEKRAEASEGETEEDSATERNTLPKPDLQNRALKDKILEETALRDLDVDTQRALVEEGLSHADLETTEVDTSVFCPLLSDFKVDETKRALAGAMFEKCKDEIGSTSDDIEMYYDVLSQSPPDDLTETLTTGGGELSQKIKAFMNQGADANMNAKQLKVMGDVVKDRLENNPEDLADVEKMKNLTGVLLFNGEDGLATMNLVTDTSILKEMCYELAVVDTTVASSTDIQRFMENCFTQDLGISYTKMVGSEAQMLTPIVSANMEIISMFSEEESKATLSSMQLKMGSCENRQMIFEKVTTGDEPLNLTDSNVLLELSTMVDQLSTEDWDTIPMESLCNLLETFSTDSQLQKQFIKARTENSFKTGTGTNSECFGETEGKIEARRRLIEAHLSEICSGSTSDVTKRRRKRSNSVTLTCDVIELLGEDVSTSTVAELDSLSNTDFEDCLEILGSVSDFTAQQWEVLADKAIEVYGTVDTWNDTYVLSTLAGIVSGLSVENLALLVLNNLEVVQDIGTNGDWSDVSKLMAGFGQFLQHYPDVDNDVTAIISTDLIALGHLACGMTSEQIGMLNSQAFCGAVENIGALTTCEETQVTQFAAHAKVCFGEDVSAWTTSQVTAMGMLIGGLGEADIQALTETHINMILPKHIATIPHTAVDDFTEAQLGYFSLNQAASLTSTQLSSLSADQLEVISVTLAGYDDVEQPTVGNEDNMDSGCGLLESSVIALMPLLMAMFCTL